MKTARAGAALASVLGLAVFSVPAAADVFEIGSDGVMVTLAGAPPRPAMPPAAPAAAPISGTIIAAAARYGLDPALVDSIAHVESRHNPRARSPKGAIGTMQLMPATARELGVDPHDPVANIHGGAAYLRRMIDRFDGDLVRAIAAYNAGPAAVVRAGGIPRFPETRIYVDRVFNRLAGAAR